MDNKATKQTWLLRVNTPSCGEFDAVRWEQTEEFDFEAGTLTITCKGHIEYRKVDSHEVRDIKGVDPVNVAEYRQREGYIRIA